VQPNVIIALQAHHPTTSSIGFADVLCTLPVNSVHSHGKLLAGNAVLLGVAVM
jgi:hypothetical protein